MKRRFGLGFKPRLGLTKEEKFLLRLDLKGKTVYDVGGYIGIYTLFFSRAVGEKGMVVSFEPMPENFEELKFNVGLNKLKNVKALNLAIGQKKSEMKMVVPAYTSRGSLDKAMQEKMLNNGGAKEITVELDSIDNIQGGKIPEPNFVKIDVEGFEMEVLRGMGKTLAKKKPELFVEVHGWLGHPIASFLEAKGYSIFHVEAEASIASEALPKIFEGHIYCKHR